MGVLFLTLLLSGADIETTRTVSGTVQDAGGGRISGADVFVACGSIWRHAATDAAGSFTFVDLPPGRCGLRVEHDQFAPQRLAVDIARDDQRVTVVLTVRGLTAVVAVTSARMGEEPVVNRPWFSTVTDADEIRARGPRILPQALAEEPGIAVQQTTSAQGSPIIRGMTGQQNVTIIDGVRLNTSAWRSGPSQYLAWYAPILVDRVEVMRGPASVLYGSDALGGTVYVRSLQPSFTEAGITVGGSATLGASTAAAGRGADALLSIGGPRAGLLAAGGYQDIGDIRAGAGRDSHAAVTRFLGLPSDTLGSNRLSGTAYSQRFAHVAAAIGVGPSTRVDASYHYDEQTGARRYDRMSGGDGLYRSEFGPQRLDLIHARVERGRTGLFDMVSASFSVNRQDDGRLEQARPASSIDSQVNTTTVFGYQGQGVRRVKRHDLVVGGELNDERIAGTRRITDSMGATARLARPDIPDGTTYRTAGLFAQDAFEAVPQRLWLRGGMRFSRFRFATTPDALLGVPDEAVTSVALTFQSGAVVRITDALRVTASAGRGFRAPNAFDLGAIGVTSVFEVTPARAAALGGHAGSTDGATAVSTGRPIGSLKPESAWSFETGARYHRGRVDATVAVYDVDLRDAIQRRTVLFTGDVVGTSIGGLEIVQQDASGRAYIASQAAPMVTRVNVSRARIVGVEGESSVRVADGWLASVFFGYARGSDLDADVPLRRVPPAMGGLRARWEPHAALWVEGVAEFSLRYARMAPGDLTDARMGARRDERSIANYFQGTAVDLGLVRDGRLVATGETLTEVQRRLLGDATGAPLFADLPGYLVMTVRAGYRVNPHVELVVIGENLTDRNYRRIGSGVDAAGANLQVRSRIGF